MKRKALGRGLDALLNPTADDRELDQIVNILIDDIIENEYQPRIKFDEDKIKELAASIEETGLIQPIIVRKLGTKYEIIAGERRFRALKYLKRSEVPCIVRDARENELLELALIENIQRENLNPIEEAMAYDSLIKRFDYTQEQLAKRVGKDRSTITNMLRLLKLPQEVKELIKNDQLSVGHAKVLLSLKTPEKQIKLADKIVKEGLSVRDVERLLKKQGSKPKRHEKSEYVADIERQLSQKFNIKVAVKENNGKGKIELYFSSLDDLDRLLDNLL